jgi:alkylhydroperoxidase/carboxymuconolactone decarboxylase family protein YurZ
MSKLPEREIKKTEKTVAIIKIHIPNLNVLLKAIITKEAKIKHKTRELIMVTVILMLLK